MRYNIYMRRGKFINSYTEDIISRLAQDETGKRQFYRPVYSLHKWWARRPGTLFRAIILLATNSENGLFEPDGSGSIPDSKKVDFDWFESALAHFDDFLVTEMQMPTGTVKEYEVAKALNYDDSWVTVKRRNDD